ncbi:MAG: RlmE family RNA methyltransferase [Deltaproteobacteria bacterium]|nr:RlmE family RNA methyltransferase [Deltaproteobacteria bacterium]
MNYHPKDAFFRRAKKEGYRSRAAYKLIELNRRFQLIRRGDLIVDLGAAPGGWLQIASQLTGKTGKVFGIDLQPIEPFREKNIHLMQGNIESEETVKRIQELLVSDADCVLSDISPKLTGIHYADVSRSLELALSAFRVAIRILKPEGNFLVKTFVGEETKAFESELKKSFRSVQATRPEATRKGSSEIYFCAKGLRKLAS